MTTFDNREKAFENQFARDDELRFKVGARRDRLVGLWAAEKLGHSGEVAETYAKTIVSAGLEEAGDEDVIRRLVADLSGSGIADPEIRAALAAAAITARKQIMEAM